MILSANRCREKSPNIYVSDEISEVSEILNPRLGDIAMVVEDGEFTVYRLVEADDLEVDGETILESNSCSYVWVIASASSSEPTFINVKSRPYNAGNGSESDTAAIQRALDDAPAGGVVLLPPDTYRAAGLVASDATTILGWGATILRNDNDADAVLKLGKYSIVEGLEVDGNKSLYTHGSSPKAQIGIHAQSYSHVRDCVVHDCAGHGIRMSDDDGTQESGWVTNCVTSDNGTNPGALGSGDGIYVQNGMDTIVSGCTSTGNARSGIVATTSTPLPSESVGVKIYGCSTSGNAYNEINTEEVTFSVIENCRSEGMITFSNSDDVRVSNCFAQIIYGQGSDRTTVSDCTIERTAGLCLFLDGTSPEISNIRARNTGVASGNCIEIAPSDGFATISDVHVNGCNNGFLITFSNLRMRNCSVRNQLNVAFKLVRDGVTRNILDLIEVNGVTAVSREVAPVSGYCKRGDRVYFPSPSAGGNIGAVCVVGDASPGTWKDYGGISP